MVSVDWPNKIINVPQSDLTLISGSVYEHDVDDFRLALKALEDDQGIPFPDTHRHTTSATIGGVTLARVVEIINGYVVTYEEGNYAVNLVGANNNIADVATVNGVSIRPSNSAGLVQVSSGSGLDAGQDSKLTAINALAARLNAMLENTGSYDRYLARALEQAPSSSGSGATPQQIWEYATRTLTALPPSAALEASVQEMLTAIAALNDGDATATNQAAILSAIAQLQSITAELHTFRGLNAAKPISRDKTGNTTTESDGTVTLTHTANPSNETVSTQRSG